MRLYYYEKPMPHPIHVMGVYPAEFYKPGFYILAENLADAKEVAEYYDLDLCDTDKIVYRGQTIDGIVYGNHLPTMEGGR
jgi:hypothetical protein